MKRKIVDDHVQEKKTKILEPELSWSNVEEAIEDKNWKLGLKDVLEDKSFVQLKKVLEEKQSSGIILYPPRHLVWNAINLCPLEKVQVVIIGQDPYVKQGEAHGLSFSVPQGVKIPPSLTNIYKAIKKDVATFKMPTSGNLESWAKQGVLLLNAVLTVEHASPNSGSELGWQKITSKMLKLVNEKESPVVFMAWGHAAQSTLGSIAVKRHHLVLKAPHPSPSNPNVYKFISCKHFQQANTFFKRRGMKAIDWSIY